MHTLFYTGAVLFIAYTALHLAGALAGVTQ